MANCVYILYSSKLNHFYVGQTSDFEVRFAQHNDVRSQYSTSKGRPWEVFLIIGCSALSQAIKIERHIKKMKSSTYIKNLKEYPEMVEKLLRKYGAHDC
ncbi:MAG: GIY-YIG nuclease family protein [Cytophagaceae bacterium]